MPITPVRAGINLDSKQLFRCPSRVALMVRTSQSDAHHMGKILIKNTLLVEILNFSKQKEILEVLGMNTINANITMKCVYILQVISGT